MDRAVRQGTLQQEAHRIKYAAQKGAKRNRWTEQSGRALSIKRLIASSTPPRNEPRGTGGPSSQAGHSPTRGSSHQVRRPEMSQEEPVDRAVRQGTLQQEAHRIKYAAQKGAKRNRWTEQSGRAHSNKRLIASSTPPRNEPRGTGGPSSQAGHSPTRGSSHQVRRPERSQEEPVDRAVRQGTLHQEAHRIKYAAQK